MALDSQPEVRERRHPIGLRARAHHVFSGSRELMRIAHRDPEHVCERLALYGIHLLGEASHEWAASTRTARPDVAPAVPAERLCSRSAEIARVDGAIAGTPFLLALVPAYLTYLWQETSMTLRIAALYGHNPTRAQMAAEILVLRGVHTSVAAAEAALLTAQAKPTPDRPLRRRSLKVWLHSIRSLLVFGGFISAREQRRGQGWPLGLKTLVSLLVTVAAWVVTWVLPVTLMMVMAWGCEQHTRQLGRRAIAFYSGEGDVTFAPAAARGRRSRRVRALWRSGALVISAALPLGFIAYADHIRNAFGINWIAGLGVVVAVSMVLSTAVLTSRRK